MPSRDVCSVCGKTVYRTKESKPAIVCRDCRRINPAPYGSRSGKSSMHVCEWCGVTFVPKSRRSEKRPPRFCSIAHATDANAHATGKVIRKGRTCEWCGKQYTASYAEQRTCSRECGAVLRNGASWEWRTLVSFPSCQGCGKARPPRASGAYCSDRCRSGHVPRGTEVTVACVECAALFSYVQVSSTPTRCDQCRSARMREQRKAGKRKQYERSGIHLHKHRKRARYYGVEYEPLRPRDVFERDGWACGICGDPVDPALKPPDLMCASLDHIVPMSKGGGHVWDNVQLAHFLCNSYKGVNESASFKIA